MSDDVQTGGNKLVDAAHEAVSVAKGEQPAPRVWENGHAYVPEATLIERVNWWSDQFGKELRRAEKAEAEVSRLTAAIRQAEEERDKANNILQWIDTWASNPAGSYSIAALEGFFSQARAKIEYINASEVLNARIEGAVLAEREACATVVQEHTNLADAMGDVSAWRGLASAVDAIRSRTEPTPDTKDNTNG